jgi:hypothetical protein
MNVPAGASILASPAPQATDRAKARFGAAVNAPSSDRRPPYRTAPQIEIFYPAGLLDVHGRAEL